MIDKATLRQSIEKKKNKNSNLRKPEWLKIKINTNDNYAALKKLVNDKKLHTVCEEAKCPNIHECWSERKTATFMILGGICTRACRFCAVKTGMPTELDLAEPERVADAVALMGLKHVVITMVARDDLRDGGAQVFAETVRAIRRKSPDTSIEVLPSDLGGLENNVATLLSAQPNIFNHNIETVRRLTPRVRSRAKYERSLQVLRWSKQIRPEIPTKTSIMIGLGETQAEIEETMDDLLAVGVNILTIGQYLQPSHKHLPVIKYYSPIEFGQLRQIAMKKGFTHCEAGPLVRSSYHADEQVDAAQHRQAILSEMQQQAPAVSTNTQSNSSEGFTSMFRK